MHKGYQVEVPKHLKEIIGGNWGKYFKRNPITGAENGLTFEVICFRGYGYPTWFSIDLKLERLGWTRYFFEDHNSLQYIRFYKGV